MIANYHTHTKRCRHADGEDREYVETAIKNGVRILGFSDHAPYPNDSIGDHRMRMRREEAEDYVKSVLSLRYEYKGQIEIYLGFETEYFPALYGEYKEFISQFPIDYLILGEHFVPEEKNGIYVGSPFSDEQTLKHYVDLCIDGLATGDFTYLAHPDVAHFTGNAKVYEKHMRRLARAMKEMNIPAEFNLLGFASYRHYPSATFFTIAKEEGLRIILGSDAHSPRHCGDELCAEKARDFLRTLGITPIDTLELVKPSL